MMIILYIFIIIFIVTPYLPATRHPHWFFRTADFVRLQSIFIELVLLILLLVFETNYTIFIYILVGSLIATIVYQIVKVFPYSSFYPRSKPNFPSDGMISVLAGNVLQTNTEYKKFIAEVNRFDPDIVLTMETNKNWENGLKSIEKKYPYSIKAANEKFYGMHLYSKKKPEHTQINYFVEDKVPSFFCEYAINDNINVLFACLHPAPPSPTENETSKERDAELMIVGKKIRKLNQPVVVCGDMNDVVWSRVTRLFKKMTAMIDPRIGRGFFPTYHAGYVWMRFPLDHLFHTKDLYVGKMERSKNFGSDHFAMYYEIHHRNGKKPETEGTLSRDEKNEVAEKIENGQ